MADPGPSKKPRELPRNNEPVDLSLRPEKRFSRIRHASHSLRELNPVALLRGKKRQTKEDADEFIEAIASEPPEDQEDKSPLLMSSVDVFHHIITFINDLPEFVHLRFEGDRIFFVNADRVNAVVRANKALLQTPELYKNSTRSTEVVELAKSLENFDKLKEPRGIVGSYYSRIKKEVDKFKEDCFPDVGLPPFELQYQQKRLSVGLRPMKDMVILENFLQTTLDSLAKTGVVGGWSDLPPFFTNTRALETVSNCVLKLDDIYMALTHALAPLPNSGSPMLGNSIQPDEDIPEPDSITRGPVYFDVLRSLFGPLVSQDAKLQRLTILVGDYHPTLRPSDLEEFKIKFRRGITASEWRDITAFPYPTQDQHRKIRFVATELDNWKRGKDDFDEDVLDSPTGRDWLRHPQLQNSGQAARWLITRAGQAWLGRRKGREWLGEGITNWTDDSKNHSFWWLSTLEGAEWLQTSEGIIFLNSDLGSGWSHSEAAALWVNQPGVLDSVWFKDHPKGRKYLQEELAGGRELPALPLRPYCVRTVHHPDDGFQDTADLQMLLQPTPPPLGLLWQSLNEYTFARFNQAAIDKAFEAKQGTGATPAEPSALGARGKGKGIDGAA